MESGIDRSAYSVDPKLGNDSFWKASEEMSNYMVDRKWRRPIFDMFPNKYMDAIRTYKTLVLEVEPPTMDQFMMECQSRKNYYLYNVSDASDRESEILEEVYNYFFNKGVTNEIQSWLDTAE